MNKIKVHELAKELNISSKEILEIAKKIGIEVKSHLSILEETDKNKIENNINVGADLISAQPTKPAKLKKEPKEPKKAPEQKEPKPQKEKKEVSAPVIIRREVINTDFIEETEKEKPEKETPKLGFVERDINKDRNIVYRDKNVKPLTASELFAMKTKKQPQVETIEVTETIELIEKIDTIEKVEKVEKVEINEKLQKEEIPAGENSVSAQPQHVSNEANIPANAAPKVQQWNPQNVQPRQQWNPQNVQPKPEVIPAWFLNAQKKNEENKANNINNNQTNTQNRPAWNNNNQNGNFQNNRPNWNNNTGGNNFNRPQGNNFNRPLNDRNIDKNIKDIMTVDGIEKETGREYKNKAIDKQKINRIDDTKNKKNNKFGSTKETRFDEINSEKLKGLKQESGLSGMFEDSNGGMLDYYDLTTVRGRKNKRKTTKIQTQQKIFKLTDVIIPENVTVKEFAAELKKTSGEIIKKLLNFGIMATINNVIDYDTAFLIAGEFGVLAHKKEIVTEEDILFDDSIDTEDELIVRAPVVVVMGHVDHGKTSLLDAIRSTNVLEKESGGITQHIGAYKVEVNEREITFLDTPGHEAFTSMRERGAKLTDIAILVVAANDGVMPQTIEAISHAKAAEIPIIVAINKMDLEGANPELIKQKLTEYDLVAEEWGGDTIFVPISAKLNQNIDKLLEMVLLVADVQELKVNISKQAKGTVIEAKLDKSKGPVATMLVQRGSLDVGDTIVVGSVIGKIRTMTDDKGRKVKNAGPSTPVEITGLTEVPVAGETFYEVKDEKTAKHLIERRKRQLRDKKLNLNAAVTLEDLFAQIEKGTLKQLNLIVKADVQGSVEAIKQSLEKLANEEVKVKVIHSSVGSVTETDVSLAKVAKAIIIAFNVRPEVIAKQIAEKNEIEIKTYSVIYEAIDDVEAAMKGMLEPKFKEIILGNVEIRDVFKVSDVGTIGGGYVTNGKIIRNAGVRVLRENIVVHTGKIQTLKRFKDDVKEVATGYECGIQVENYNEMKIGDLIEAFIMEEIK